MVYLDWINAQCELHVADRFLHVSIYWERYKFYKPRNIFKLKINLNVNHVGARNTDCWVACFGIKTWRNLFWSADPSHTEYYDLGSNHPKSLNSNLESNQILRDTSIDSWKKPKCKEYTYPKQTVRKGKYVIRRRIMGRQISHEDKLLGSTVVSNPLRIVH